MLREIKVLTSISYTAFSTVYLYDQKERLLLPVNISNELPSGELLKKTVELLGGELISVQIFNYIEDTFYTNIVIGQNNRLIEVTSDLSNIINVVVNEKLPLMIEEEILVKNGIRITAKLIKDALAI